MVADYAFVEIGVQVGKVTNDYSQYVAHDFFDGERSEFVSGLESFRRKENEIVRRLESSI